jgi:hypothetical protein
MIVSAIQLVAKYVAQFLANFSPAQVKKLGAKAQGLVTVSNGDHAKLVAIGAKAQANIVGIAKLRLRRIQSASNPSVINASDIGAIQASAITGSINASKIAGGFIK